MKRKLEHQLYPKKVSQRLVDDVQCDEIECEHVYTEVEPDVNICSKCGEYLPIWDDELEYDGRGDEPQSTLPCDDGSAE